MKLFSVVLSGMLVSSQFIVFGGSDSVYYQEFKVFKKAPRSRAIFTNYLGESRETPKKQLLNISLGSIQRDVMMSKYLSLFQMMLQYGFFYLDLVIVTPETMPILYSYVDDIFHKAGVVTPIVFVTREKHHYGSNDIFSSKILIFQGSIVIGQELLRDLSEGELEAVIAHEVCAIKYNHFNKKILISLIVTALWGAMIQDKNSLYKDNIELVVNLGNLLQNSFLVGLCMTIISKLFEKQSDRFVCEMLGKTKDLLSCFNRLQNKEQLKKVEFTTTYHLLQEGKSRISILPYILLVSRYCVAKVFDFLRRTCNEICSTTPEARIEAAKKYLR